MKTSRQLALLAGCLALALVSPARALVPGGGLTGADKKVDCYAEWQVSTRSNVATNKGRNQFVCHDGDSSCDIDGVQNGSCEIGVSICGFQTDTTLTKCTPAPVTAFDKIGVKVLKVKGASSAITVTPPVPPSVPVASPDCGTQTLFNLPLGQNRKGQPTASAKVKFKMRAIAGKKDPDTLTVQCVPGVPVCGANPQGGPKELQLTTLTGGLGGDLDNGWNGISHNFPIVGDSLISFCLSGCDSGANPSCTGSGKTGPNTANGKTFGAPLPLLASSTPVCVVNRYDPNGPDGNAGTADDNTITATANFSTGAVDAKLHLLSDVYITTTTPGGVCPQCSGSKFGDFGTCVGGRTPGAACRVDGTGFVDEVHGLTSYFLSTQCLPVGSPVGTLKIALDPFSTGTTTGGKCSGQASDDGCGGGTCNAPCTGPACVSKVTDATNPTGPQVCKDVKGGISQLCCSNDTTLPCFPTHGGGQITRTGLGTVPVPDGAGAAFPASGSTVLTSVFCEPATGNGTLDNATTGLPGPGALIQPMSAKWLPNTP